MVDLMPLTGLIGTAQLEVGAEHTAPFVGSGRIAVLATPVMINIIEAAALNAPRCFGSLLNPWQIEVALSDSAPLLCL
jgi:hypothetical protein